MNDGDPSSPIVWASSLRLFVALLTALLLAGSISAMTTVLRMRRSGLITTENGGLPGHQLLEHARSVLLTATISFLAVASFAAGEVPVLVRAIDASAQWWLWARAWGRKSHCRHCCERPSRR